MNQKIQDLINNHNKQSEEFLKNAKEIAEYTTRIELKELMSKYQNRINELDKQIDNSEFEQMKNLIILRNMYSRAIKKAEQFINNM